MFATTQYVDAHRATLPQAARLVTFRRPALALMQYRDATYFRFWEFLSFSASCVVWLGMFLLHWPVRRRAAPPVSPALCYAVALSVVGVFMTLLNCFSARMQPRFALPMFELLLVSSTVLLAALAVRFLAKQPAVSPTP